MAVAMRAAAARARAAAGAAARARARCGGGGARPLSGMGDFARLKPTGRGKALRIKRYPTVEESAVDERIAHGIHGDHGIGRGARAKGDAWDYTDGYMRVAVLDRPRALNALTLSMVDFLAARVDSWEQSDKVQSIVVRARGGKAFCAGGDIVALQKAAKAGGSVSAFFRREYELNYAIGRLATPYTAIMDGITMGGGVGISVHGRFRVATERTLFAMPECGIGFFPDVGGSYFLPRLAGGLGVYLALTGARLRGADLVHAGIATHFVPSDMLPELLSEIGLARTAGSAASELCNGRYDRAADQAPFSLEQHMGAIDRCFSLDDNQAVEDVVAALRREDSDWARKTLETLERQCPLSLKVTHRQMVEGARLPVEECFRMEFRLAQRFMKDPNFTEGVRALLIDGDKKPLWTHDSVEAVTDRDVDSFFAPMADSRDELLVGDLNPATKRERELMRGISASSPHYRRYAFGKDPHAAHVITYDRIMERKITRTPR